MKRSAADTNTATGTFEPVIGHLFGICVFLACTVILKVSKAIAKPKGHFLSFPDNLNPHYDSNKENAKAFFY